jgi:hypothetical protein
MGAVELVLAIAYLAAMIGYGHLCYVQGVMDRDRVQDAPQVWNAIRMGGRFLEPARLRRRPMHGPTYPTNR